MVTNPLWFIVISPIILGMAGFFLPNPIKKILGVGLLSCNLFLTWLVFIKPPASFTFNGAALFTADALSGLIMLFISVLGLIIYIYALKNIPAAYEGKSLTLILLTVGFSQGVAVSRGAVPFIVFWGLSGLMLYFYGLLNNPRGADSAKKTFLMVGGSDAFLIIGLAVLQFSAGGSFSLYSTIFALNTFWLYFALASLLLAALTKAGGFPMHTWVPVFSSDSPVEGAALLPAALDKLLGIYLLFRIVHGMFILPFFINSVIMIIGALTIITAVMMALIQHNGRKLLGYHAVSQVGYMVLGLGAGNPIGLVGGLFHMLNNALYKACLFLSLGSVEKRTGTSDLDSMGGLARLMPLTFLSCLISALAISGMPPLNGFVSKWMIYQSLIAGAQGRPIWQQGIFIFCLVCAVFGSGLTLASFLKFLYAVYFGKTRPAFAGAREIDLPNWLATLTLALICLVLGVFAFPLAIRTFILPVLGITIDISGILPGFYHSYLMIFLFGLAFIPVCAAYLVFRKVKFDGNYVGGQEDQPDFFVSGAHFYDHIHDMSPLKSFYDLAQKRYFDLYHGIGNLVYRFSLLFRKMHDGILTTYTIWTLAGLIIALFMFWGE
ncbi:MAG: proton-conducting transporter membrane subunit [Bacillota bacterium]